MTACLIIINPIYVSMISLLSISISLWPFLPLFFMLISAMASNPSPTSPSLVQLLSSSAAQLSLVSGLTARFQCSVYRCGKNSNTPPNLCWYKDGIMLFNGTEFEPTSGVEPSQIILQRSIDPSGEKPINDPNGNTCIGEEFTVLLRNLSVTDSGKYSCQLWGTPQQLDFLLNVIEGAIKLNFTGKLAYYDHTECCIERGVSPLCRPMCRPRDMGDEFFDPTSCQVYDFKNFLSCATDNGKRDYVPCCRQKKLPPFCFDFCSNNFQILKDTHRLCLYYLPEIFDCFSRQFPLQPPPAPTGLRTTGNKGGGRKLCWTVERPVSSVEEATGFSVNLQEMPEMQWSSSEGDTNLPKRKKRKSAAPSARRPSIPILRIPTVTLVHESMGNKKVSTTKMHPKSIEWASSDELCIPIPINGTSRYIVYMQASNAYGPSEPSRPFFI